MLELMIRSRSTKRLASIFTAGLAMSFFGQGAQGEGPTNLQLIAAMPPGTESVMVVRISELKGKNSILRNEYGRKRKTKPGRDIKTVVTNAITQAAQTAFAWGGSDFTMPVSTGVTGDFNERAIYVVTRPLDALAAQLEKGTDVEGIQETFESGGVKVFKGIIDKDSVWAKTQGSGGEPWFVAVANPHTVVSAESRSDIEFMLASLQSKHSEVPAQWRAIAKGHNLQAPIVILRAFPHPSKEPQPGAEVFQPPKDSGARQFALTLPDVGKVALKVSINARDADAVARWFQGRFLPDKIYTWDMKPSESGLTGTVSPKQEEGRPSYMSFALTLVFGLRIVN